MDVDKNCFCRPFKRQPWTIILATFGFVILIGLHSPMSRYAIGVSWFDDVTEDNSKSAVIEMSGNELNVEDANNETADITDLPAISQLPPDSVAGILQKALTLQTEEGQGSKFRRAESECMAAVSHLRQTVEDYDTLFYGLQLETECQYSVYGSPFDVLPQMRNPCWISSMPEEIACGNDVQCRTTFPQGLTDGLQLRCLPYAFIAGVAKSGTGDLLGSIKLHPQVAVAKKELHYWDRLFPNEPLLSYASQMNGAVNMMSKPAKDTDQPDLQHITFDSTPATLWRWYQWQELPANKGLEEPKYLLPHTLKYLLPGARFILLLRNPTDRAYSHYRRIKGKALAPLSDFHDHVVADVTRWRRCFLEHSVRACVYNVRLSLNQDPDRVIRNMDLESILAPSLYIVYIREWMEIYHRKQFSVIKSEEYYSNRTEIAEGVFRFLDLPELPVSAYAKIQARRIKNSSTRHARDKSPMGKKTRQLLDAFFEPFNQELADFLDDEKFTWKD